MLLDNEWAMYVKRRWTQEIDAGLEMGLTLLTIPADAAIMKLSFKYERNCETKLSDVQARGSMKVCESIEKTITAL